MKISLLSTAAFIHEAASDAYITTRAVTGEEIIEQAKAILDQQCTEKMPLADAKTAKNFFLMQLSGLLSHEVFGVAFLDTQNRLIAYETLFRGSIRQTVIYPREIAKRALKLNAVNVMFGHNHPSGDTTPSKADQAITTTLSKALQLLDITVVDHFIVGGNQVLSFVEQGLCYHFH
jgi:DNA repair protein RadC